jgi:hypothetical protein
MQATVPQERTKLRTVALIHFAQSLFDLNVTRSGELGPLDLILDDLGAHVRCGAYQVCRARLMV